MDFLGCVDIDDCLSNPCGVGTCTDTFETDARANSYTCVCPDGLYWDELVLPTRNVTVFVSEGYNDQCIHTDACTEDEVCRGGARVTSRRF